MISKQCRKLASAGAVIILAVGAVLGLLSGGNQQLGGDLSSTDLACIDEVETAMRKIGNEVENCPALAEMMASPKATMLDKVQPYERHPMEAECIRLHSAWKGPNQPGKLWEELFDECSFTICTVLIARETINQIIREPGDCAAALDAARAYLKAPD